MGDVKIYALELKSNTVTIPNTTSADFGVIYMGDVRFCHAYGTNNVFLGKNAGSFSVTGSLNVGVGALALSNLTSGVGNFGLGSYALLNVTSGNNNTAVGASALRNIQTSSYNVGIGANAGYYNLGTGNVFIGTSANGNQSSSNSGNYNVYIGFYSGLNATGSSNVFIGYQSGMNETGSNKFILANSSVNILIYGDFVNKMIGIGTTAVTSTLHLKGSFGYNQLRLETPYTPSGSGDTNGNTGDIAWDDSNIYVKTSTGWKKASLSPL